MNETETRLEYLRGQIRAERISYGELAELQGMADQIDPGDVELLEWAGVPEEVANLMQEIRAVDGGRNTFTSE